MSGYDYENYGSFKQAGNDHSNAKALARRMGFGNRYLRFMKGIPHHGAVLELGCGNGEFMRELRAAGFDKVRGVEISPSYAPQDDIHIGDAQSYMEALKPKSLDGIVALDVFEHIPQADLRGLLMTAKTRLKPGGRVVFRVPNMASPLALTNYYGDLSHVTALNEGSIRQLAFDVNLEVEAVHPEPMAYPRTPLALLGIVVWPTYLLLARAVLRSFGVQQRILTPNLVAILRTP